MQVVSGGQQVGPQVKLAGHPQDLASPHDPLQHRAFGLQRLAEIVITRVNPAFGRPPSTCARRGSTRIASR